MKSSLFVGEELGGAHRRRPREEEGGHPGSGAARGEGKVGLGLLEGEKGGGKVSKLEYSIKDNRRILGDGGQEPHARQVVQPGT